MKNHRADPYPHFSHVSLLFSRAVGSEDLGSKGTRLRWQALRVSMSESGRETSAPPNVVEGDDPAQGECDKSGKEREGKISGKIMNCKNASRKIEALNGGLCLIFMQALCNFLSGACR